MARKTPLNDTDENLVGKPEDSINETPVENIDDAIGEPKLDQQTPADEPDISQANLEMEEFMAAGDAAPNDGSNQIEPDISDQALESQD